MVCNQDCLLGEVQGDDLSGLVSDDDLLNLLRRDTPKPILLKRNHQRRRREQLTDEDCGTP